MRRRVTAASALYALVQQISERPSLIACSMRVPRLWRKRIIDRQTELSFGRLLSNGEVECHGCKSSGALFVLLGVCDSVYFREGR
jgi:hypothetical protein